jgi:hypothetical protein
VAREPGRQDEAEGIIDFMLENELSSLLPAGTITWESYNGTLCSTVDVVLASKALGDAATFCGIHQNDHGSDHKAIRVHFELDLSARPPRRRKRMYDKADWEEIRRLVRERMLAEYHPVVIHTPQDLDVAADKFQQVVNDVLEQQVTRVRPSPFAKRWWSGKLTVLRDSLSAARNHLTTIRRRGEDMTEAAAKVKLTRRIYLDEVDRRKREQWSDFLDDRDNIWKAYAGLLTDKRTSNRLLVGLSG